MRVLLFSMLLITSITGCNQGTIEIPAGVRPITQPELSKLDSEAQGKIKFACTSLIQIQAGTQVLPELSKLAAQYGQAGMLLHAYAIMDQAAICYQNAILLDPDESLRWHYLLAHVLREANQMPEAIEHFNEAERIYTKLGNQQPELHQAIYYYLGDTHLSLHQLDQAESAFRKALEVEESAIAYWGLGKVQLANSPTDAITPFQSALKLVPGTRTVHYSLMMAYNKMGNRRQAQFHQQEFDKGGFELFLSDPILDSVEDLKTTTAALRSRGDAALFTYGDFPTAIRHYTSALEKSPKDTSLHLNLGLAKLRMNRLGEASEHFHDTLEINPKNSRALTNLGLIAAARNDLTQALSLLESAVAAEPSNHEIRQQLARFLVADGQSAEAIQHLQKIIERSPANQPALTMLIFCLLANDRFEESQLHLETALAIFPSDQELAFYGVFGFATAKEESQRDITRAKQLFTQLDRPQRTVAEGFLFAGQGLFEEAVKVASQLEQSENLLRYQNQQLPVLIHYSEF